MLFRAQVLNAESVLIFMMKVSIALTTSKQLFLVFSFFFYTDATTVFPFNWISSLFSVCLSGACLIIYSYSICVGRTILRFFLLYFFYLLFLTSFRLCILLMLSPSFFFSPFHILNSLLSMWLFFFLNLAKKKFCPRRQRIVATSTA